MKPTKQSLTPEQITARKIAEDFFADLLKPLPKAKKINASVGAKHPSIQEIVSRGAFRPTLRIYTVTHQHCTTCNSQHTYTGTALIQHTSHSRKDGLSLAIPTALPEALETPIQVNHVYEETDFCATCIDMALTIEQVLHFAPEPVQYSLFH